MENDFNIIENSDKDDAYFKNIRKSLHESR